MSGVMGFRVVVSVVVVGKGVVGRGVGRGVALVGGGSVVFSFVVLAGIACVVFGVGVGALVEGACCSVMVMVSLMLFS